MIIFQNLGRGAGYLALNQNIILDGTRDARQSPYFASLNVFVSFLSIFPGIIEDFQVSIDILILFSYLFQISVCQLDGGKIALFLAVRGCGF